MAAFVDRVVLHLAAGDGGHGCVSIHREKFQPLGGPDGGNGGNGGDVTLVVDSGVHTLLDFHYHPHQKAGNGRSGQGRNRNGANGRSLRVSVPEGTVVQTADGEAVEVLADLTGVGTEYVVARGGRGGLGNAALASTRRRAPGFALRGEPGEARDVVLELKSVADVGLVGFPSAGKSSLISVLSAARPKIADYPFTTLVPNLGVVAAGDTTFTIADVPGLIPGASSGRGLGLEFLRHVERTAVLVHVLDCATEEPGRDPVSDLEAIERELSEYGGLADRPRIAVLTKTDVPDAADLAELVRPELQARGLRVFAISAVAHQGLEALAHALAELVTAARAERPAAEARRVVLRPAAVDESAFSVSGDPDDPDAFVVTGAKPERWVRQTDFDNEEAVGYLADRLARLGVEAELARAGARPGADVTIGEMTFGWEPTVESVGGGVETGPLGHRGSDPRLAERPRRPTAGERMAARRARRRSDADDAADETAADSDRADDGTGDGS